MPLRHLQSCCPEVIQELLKLSEGSRWSQPDPIRALRSSTQHGQKVANFAQNGARCRSDGQQWALGGVRSGSERR